MSDPTPDQRDNDARLLREFLADRDRSCPTCGYNLRNLTSMFCPECGAELRLQVGTPAPLASNMVWLMAPPLGMISLGILFLILIIPLGAPRGWGWPLLEMTAVLDIPLCLYLYRHRRSVLLLNRRTFWVLFLLMTATHVTILYVGARMMR
jgi:hypothetical protein